MVKGGVKRKLYEVLESRRIDLRRDTIARKSTNLLLESKNKMFVL